jgi:hypothetical protein
MEFVKLSPTETKARKAIANEVDKFLAKEYPDAYTPFVVSYILSEGYQTLKETSDESINETVKNGYEKAKEAEELGHILIMTPLFQEHLVRAAVALCHKFDLFDILSFARCQFVF